MEKSKPIIETGNSLPGIIGLMKYRPETAVPLNALADVLLRSLESTLTRGEREFVFAAASYANECEFCAGVHAQCAAIHLDNEKNVNGSADALMELLRIQGPCAVADDTDQGERLHQLAHLAAVVATRRGLDLRLSMAETHDLFAKVLSPQEIHDAVLIASSACMYNRYVDAMNTDIPEHDGFYKEASQMLTSKGYVGSVP